MKSKSKMVTALIIDDETDICFLLRGILRTKNLQVSYANSLSDATVVLAKENPEIIFLDNHLPDGLGVDFVSQLKATHPLAKVVMISAYDLYSDRTKAFANGVDTFIPKPFTKEIISQTVDQLVQA